MSFITAENLVKSYGQGGGRVTALAGVSFTVAEGEFVAVMGASGSGKSTLLSILGGLTSPDSGAFTVDGLEVYRLNQDQRADFRREYLGFVFQSFHLVPYLSLLENVMLPLVIKKLPGSEKRDLAREALARVGLGDKVTRLPGQVSGGEQERAAVARALVNQPPILLADEPTGNLDRHNSGEIMRLLSRLGQEGMTIIMVTHSPECAATAQRIISLADGRLVTESTPAELAAACALGAPPLAAAW
ncbi:MAG: ABC transporter ATP-binding protein [Deltaproteobacteria bacterium]|nr:ABC transporter ATP-binding protein [Deltaproteobacteria bacterium]